MDHAHHVAIDDVRVQLDTVRGVRGGRDQAVVGLTVLAISMKAAPERAIAPAARA
jgi:hypothetical protein